jgi:hypothetical protein
MRLSRKIFCLALLVGSALLPPASATAHRSRAQYYCVWYQCAAIGDYFLCCAPPEACIQKAADC